MLRNFRFIFLSAILASCGSNHAGENKTTLASHFLSISKNEDKGIKEVINFYGGECEYGFTNSNGTGVQGGNVFWMEVRKSPAIDNSTVNPELWGSNIAYLFYRNLKEEKKNYTAIQVTIKRADDQEKEFTYPVSLLDDILMRHTVVEKVFSYIKHKDYNRLSDHIVIDTAFSSQTKEDLLNGLRDTENNLGTIRSLIPYGFRIVTYPNGRQLLFLSGMVLREGEKHPLTVVMDINSRDDKILFLDYNFIPQS